MKTGTKAIFHSMSEKIFFTPGGNNLKKYDGWDVTISSDYGINLNTGLRLFVVEGISRWGMRILFPAFQGELTKID